MRMSGLFRKILLTIVFLFALIAITITVFSGWNLRRHLTDEFQSKGMAIANGISSSIVEIVLNGDASTIQSTIDQFTEIRGVSYVFVVDPLGEIIAHTFVPAVPDNLRNLETDPRQIQMRDLEIESLGAVTDIAAPILAGVAGYVHVGMNREIINSHIRSAILNQIYLLLVIFLAASAVAWLAARSVTRPIRMAAEAVQRVARGDLTGEVEVTSGDETGELLKATRTMTQNLNKLVGQVKTSGHTVMTAATEIAATARHQESAVHNLRSSSVEIVTTATEISATSEELATTMGDVAGLARETSELAETSQGGLLRMEETMRNLVQETGSISQQLTSISEKAADINQIIETITRVADQSNLLSLNAAIEAQKAGEYGKGFAVVAREIRRLADQSAVATLNIEKVIQEMHAAIGSGVQRGDRFTEGVNLSAREVTRVSGQLSQIIQRVQNLSPRFQLITEGMQVQSQGAHQISDAMTTLSETAQQTADSLQEFMRATQQLQEAATALSSEVSTFRTGTHASESSKSSRASESSKSSESSRASKSSESSSISRK